MFPVIFSIGPVTLYTFGVFLFLAFFAGLFVVWKRGKELHFDEEALFDAVFGVLWWTFLGARVGYVLLKFPEFSWQVWQWVNVFGRPGFLFWGGLVGAGIGVFRQADKRKWDAFALADVLAVGLTLAQAITALGAFFNGSGYGVPTSLPFGMTFAGLLDRRHPVQLYETVLFLLLFWYLWWVEGVYRTFSWYKRSRSEANSGFILSLYLIGQGVFGTVLTILRPVAIVVSGIRVDICLAAIWILVGLGLLIRRSGLRGSDVISWVKPVPIPGRNEQNSREAASRERRHDPGRIKLGRDILD